MTQIRKLCSIVLIGWLSFWLLPAAAAQDTVSADAVLETMNAALYPDDTTAVPDSIYFENVEIQGVLDLTKLVSDDTSIVTINLPVYFINVRFTGAVLASTKNQGKTVTVHFDGGVNFRDTTFYEAAVFSGAAFSGSNFDSVQFMQAAEFQQTQFSMDASFRQAVFGQITALELADPCIAASQEAQFNFSGAVFDAPVDFSQAIICQPGFFIGTQFLQDARFVGFRFASANDPLDFTNVHFGGSAVFQGSKFPLVSTFTAAQFMDEANFTAVEFGDEVRFNNVTFTGQTDFQDAQFSIARFGDATFTSEADFSGTLFKTEANFKDATFKARADFHDAHFGEFSLEAAAFEQILDLNNIQISGGLNFRNTAYTGLAARRFDFDALNRWKDQLHLPDTGNASSADDYLISILAQLENKFRSQDQLELANEAFYRRKILERKQLNPLDGVLADVVDHVMGYGVLAWRVMTTAVILILVFTCFYCWENTLREIERDSSAKRKLRLIDIPIVFEEKASLPRPDNEPGHKSSFPRRFITGLGFSVGIFTKLNLVNKACHHKWIKWLVILEWGLSVVLLAALLYTLSNTNYLLHELLQALLP